MEDSMNDLMTVIGCFGGFSVFFLLHLFVFRRIRQEHAVRWFFVLIAAISLALPLVGFPWITSILFVLLSSSFFMGVFGLVATSVRIRILSDIARAGSRGMTYHEILMRYNRDMIVAARLARLVGSGDIVRDGTAYRAAGRLTFFMFPALVLRAMKFLYG